jgi:uncharacterized membrane protein
MRIPPYTFRAGIALASVVSGAVALYLHLWKRSFLEQTAAALAEGNFQMLQCGVGGGCTTVQMSGYGWFLGVDVALIGTLGYSAILLVAALGLVPRWHEARWPTVALMALIFPAVLFTIRLKYAEFYLMRTFCSWCAVSTVAITICAILVTLDHRRLWRDSGGPANIHPSHLPDGAGAPVR